MVITQEFDYFKPATINKALDILDKFKQNAALLAGGTDLIVKMKDDIEKPKVIIDIKSIDELNKIEFKNNSLYIGATVTFSDLLDKSIVKKKFPLLWESIKTIASVGIRNRATLVGNICSAVPSLDSGPALLVYESVVNVTSKKGKRKIPISEWFLGPKKNALKPGEIIMGITVPLPKEKNGTCYMKLGRYKGEDLAQAGVGILVSAGDNTYKIAFCALCPTPIRAEKIESILNGNLLDNSLIEKAQDLVCKVISPITDIRATKEYRIHMAKVMLKRSLKTAVSRLNGKGPELGLSLLGG